MWYWGHHEEIHGSRGMGRYRKFEYGIGVREGVCFHERGALTRDSSISFEHSVVHECADPEVG